MSAPGKTSPWFPLLSASAPGTHAILWSDGSEECDAAINTFVKAGVDRNNLVLVVLPKEELGGLEQRLRVRGTDLNELADEGSVLRIPSEEATPHKQADIDRIPREIAEFVAFARSVGKEGISVLDRVAPLFFEAGDQGMAVRIESAVNDYRGASRFLCLYKAAGISIPRLPYAVQLTRLHTDAITALGGGRFFVEPVAPPTSRPKIRLERTTVPERQDSPVYVEHER